MGYFGWISHLGDGAHCGAQILRIGDIHELNAFPLELPFLIFSDPVCLSRRELDQELVGV